MTPSATHFFERPNKISHPFLLLDSALDALPSFAASSQSAKIGLQF